MLHVPSMPEAVHVSFSPEHGPALPTAQPDPVFALIEAHRTAFDVYWPLLTAWSDIPGGTPEYDAAEAATEEPHRRERAAFRALLEARPATAAGLWALTAYLPEATRKISPDERTEEQAALDVLREGALRLGLVAAQAEANAVRSAHVDPHVALLPTLRQAYAWDRAARPISNAAAFKSLEESASGAVQSHCWDVAERIIALPAPQTLPGLGALALALSVMAELSICSAGYPEDKRHAAAIRAMMSAAGVEPLPDWCGFGDEDAADPLGSARYGAMLDRISKGSLPAWALAGKSAPDAEEIATSGEALPTDLPKVAGPEAPNLDLSGYSVPELCALFDVYERAEDQFYAAGWWPKLGDAGSQLVADEGDRCLALKGVVADELRKRKPGRESDADERAEKLMRRQIMNGDWDATAQLACSLRNEVAACHGKH